MAANQAVSSVAHCPATPSPEPDNQSIVASPRLLIGRARHLLSGSGAGQPRRASNGHPPFLGNSADPTAGVSHQVTTAAWHGQAGEEGGGLGSFSCRCRGGIGLPTIQLSAT